MMYRTFTLIAPFVFSLSLQAETDSPVPIDEMANCINAVRGLVYFDRGLPIASRPEVARLNMRLLQSKNFEELSEAARELRLLAREPAFAVDVAKTMIQAYKNSNSHSREFLNVQLQGIYGDLVNQVRLKPDTKERRQRVSAIEMIEKSDVIESMLNDYIDAIKKAAQRHISENSDAASAALIKSTVIDFPWNAAGTYSTLESDIFFKALRTFPRPTQTTTPILGFKFEPTFDQPTTSQHPAEVSLIANRSLHGIDHLDVASRYHHHESVGVSSGRSLSTDLNLRARYLATIALNFQEALSLLNDPLDPRDKNQAISFIKHLLKEAKGPVVEAHRLEQRIQAAQNARRQNSSVAPMPENSDDDYHSLLVIELKRSVLQGDLDTVTRVLHFLPTAERERIGKAISPTAHLLGHIALAAEIDSLSGSRQSTTNTRSPEKLLMRAGILPVPRESASIGSSSSPESFETRLALTEFAARISTQSITSHDLHKWALKLLEMRRQASKDFQLLIDEALLQIAHNPNTFNALRRLIEIQLRSQPSRSEFYPFSLRLLPSPLSVPVAFPIQAPQMPISEKPNHERFASIQEALVKDLDLPSYNEGTTLKELKDLNELVNAYVFKKPSLLWKLRNDLDRILSSNKLSVEVKLKVLELAENNEAAIRRSLEYFGYLDQSGSKSDTVLLNAARIPDTTFIASQILSKRLSSNPTPVRLINMLNTLHNISRQIAERRHQTRDISVRDRFDQSLSLIERESSRAILNQEIEIFKDKIQQFKEGFEGPRAQALEEILQTLNGNSRTPFEISDLDRAQILLEAHHESDQTGRVFPFPTFHRKVLNSSDEELHQKYLNYMNGWYRYVVFVRDFHGGTPHDVEVATNLLYKLKQLQQNQGP